MPRLTDRTAWILWGVLFAIMCGLILAGNKKTVAVNYFKSAEHWRDGAPLYDGTGNGFLYFPQSAVLCLPLTLLPPTGREIVWRIFTIGIFAVGVWRLAKLAEGVYQRPIFPLTTLVAIPLAWSSARNGQATLAIAGLTMLAAAGPAEGRWRSSAVWLALGIAVKPLMIVPALLALVHRPMRVRLAIAVAICAAVPFALQSPTYVAEQYVATVDMLRDAGAVHEDGYWATLFGLIRACGIRTPEFVQTLVRALAAVGTLALVWTAVRRTPPAIAAVYSYTFAACYLMLFSPRTENNAYSFLGPAIGLFFAHACVVQRDWRRAAFLAAIAFGTVSSYQVGRWLSGPREAIWLAPLMGTLFALYAMFTLRQMIFSQAAAARALPRPAKMSLAVGAKAA